MNDMFDPSKELAPEIGQRVRTDGDTTSIVVGFVPDQGNIVIIYKTWSLNKQRWFYKSELIDDFLFKLHLTRQIYYGKFGEGKKRT